MSLIEAAISPAEVAQIVGQDYFEDQIATVACINPESRDIFQRLRTESGWSMVSEAETVLMQARSLCAQCAIRGVCESLAPTTGESKWRGVYGGLTGKDRFEETGGRIYNEELVLSKGVSSIIG